jgi:5-methylcytosine-specific restriction endonuclease McrA
MKRHNKQESEDLWKWMELRPYKWWKEGTPFGPKFGWTDIYEADNWHCIYCGRDLAESEDVLAESTEEHLVPQSLFAVGKQSGNVPDNVAASCTGCNSLKGPLVPPIGDTAWSSRKAYIAAMRKFIAEERSKRAAEYRLHAFNARAKRIWTCMSKRQGDYLENT